MLAFTQVMENLRRPNQTEEELALDAATLLTIAEWEELGKLPAPIEEMLVDIDALLIANGFPLPGDSAS
jgi:hypothetical protein